MKAIIVAAGPGKRLRPLTDDRPKCMLKIDGKTILERTTEAMKKCGVEDIVVVRGYKKEAINYPDFTYFDNPDFMKNNILASLFYAEKEMEDGFIFSYSDILYGPSTVQKLLDNDGDISIIVDVDWAKRYEGRRFHPTDEAEIVTVKNNKVELISKFMNPDIAYGEFIGLAKFTKKGAEILVRNYNRILNNMWCGHGPNQRFYDATNLEKAYVTDMLQELIDRGYVVKNVDIKGNWIEIDTPQDFERASKEEFV